MIFYNTIGERKRKGGRQNRGIIYSNFREKFGIGINRNIVECKDNYEDAGLMFAQSINRNIVECKVYSSK